jgi:hypothetical protein
MAFGTFGRQRGDFDHGIEAALARLLRAQIHLPRGNRTREYKSGQTRARISDVELASRLRFSLEHRAGCRASIWQRRETWGSCNAGSADAAHVEGSPFRSLSINFAGQWLNLRGMQSAGPLPMYPTSTSSASGMRREVELFFDSIVREDRGVSLLTADYIR